MQESDSNARRRAEERGKKQVELFDSSGALLREQVPKVLSASFCRRAHFKGAARVGLYDKDGKAGPAVRYEVVRAQVPYVVTLLIYKSKFDMTPVHREYFVYAPMEIQKAAELALRLWQRWERPPRPKMIFGDMEDQYPKVGEGVVAEPIGDEDFDGHWKDVQKRPHRKAGDPSDPFAFTCLDQDVRLYKSADFQEGLDVRIG